MCRSMSGAAAGKKTMDVHGVAALLRALLAEGQDEQAIELVVGLLSQLTEKNAELELRLRKALRQHFGRTSEKLSAEQLSLFLSELGQQEQASAASAATAPAAQDAAPAPASAPGTEQPWKKRKGHGRRPLPSTLPREQRMHQPPPEALSLEYSDDFLCDLVRSHLPDVTTLEIVRALDMLSARASSLRELMQKDGNHVCPGLPAKRGPARDGS